MLYVLGVLLVLSLVFNYFGVRLIGEQSIKLNKLNFELFSLKMQLDLEKTKHSEDSEDSITSERIVQ
jgi:hypothetical protein